MFKSVTTSCAILAATVALAEGEPEQPTMVDAKLVTGIDISDSVSAAEIQLQLTGLAAAVRSADFLNAIKNGRRGCIGFEVFAWHYGDSPEIVHWTIISDMDEAETVAQQIEARPVVDLYAESRAAAGRYCGSKKGTGRSA